MRRTALVLSALPLAATALAIISDGSRLSFAADPKVKPGQQIRIVAREAGGNPKDRRSDFPELLTLK